MTIASLRLTVIAVLALCGLGIGLAAAQSTGLSTAWSYRGAAKVTAIDHAARKISLVTPDGRRGTYAVNPVVRNLDRIKVGDTVNALYEERITFVLSEAGTKVPTPREVRTAKGAPKGEPPSGVVTREEVVNFRVIAVDAKAYTLSVVPVDGGPVVHRNVIDPAARATLPRVKPGDYLTVIERETLLAEITTDL